MTDELDREGKRIANVSVMMSDPTDGVPHDTVKHTQLSALISDLNNYQADLLQHKNTITPEFIATATREQIETKELEIKTVLDLYRSKYLELDRTYTSATTQRDIDNQKASMDEKEKQIKEMFKTSKFAIASAHQKAIHELYEKLKDEKAKITSDYLHSATIEDLQQHRSTHSDWYTDFLVKFGTLRLDDLEAKEINGLAYAQTNFSAPISSICCTSL
jgi:NADH dehydrogenase/NADH:ubiquinone oxidoreductase subunit G